MPRNSIEFQIFFLFSLSLRFSSVAHSLKTKWTALKVRLNALWWFSMNIESFRVFKWMLALFFVICFHLSLCVEFDKTKNRNILSPLALSITFSTCIIWGHFGRSVVLLCAFVYMGLSSNTTKCDSIYFMPLWIALEIRRTYKGR